MSEETRIVIDMTLLLIISGVCSLVFAKIKMPPILGYLTAGIILGPTMLPELWVEATTVTLLSNIGIVLLMFYIGLETDLSKLKVSGSKLIFVVCVQMPIVVAAGYLLGILLGFDSVQSIFLGAIISGTSTAVVVGVLKESKHIDPETARNIITITIFEDVGQVLIMTMAAPLLAGDSPALGSTLFMIIGLILFIGMAIVFGMAVVPRFLNYIGKRYSSEILLIISVGLCFAMASISMAIGLSIAIGAFIMGMMISNSSVGHSIAAKVEPVKDLFMAVFFISIGLQISPHLIIANILLASAIAAVFIVSKIGSVGLACYLTNMSVQKSLLIGTSLVAMGEFAFIIAKQALDAGIVDQNFYSAVIGAALISMVVMPLITKAQPRMFDAANKRLPNRLHCALARVDQIRSAASGRMQSTSPASKDIRRSISLIFVDCMVIILVMIVFNVFGNMNTFFTDVATKVHVLPQELLILLLLVALSPAIYNIHYHVRSIAQSLTKLAMESPNYRKGSEKAIYPVFYNVGNIAMILAILVLIIPFIPEDTIVSPIGLIVVVVSAMVILFLAWDTLRKGYDRFYTMIGKTDDCPAEGRPPEGKER